MAQERSDPQKNFRPSNLPLSPQPPRLANLPPTLPRNKEAENGRPKAEVRGQVLPMSRGGSSPIADALQHAIARMDSAGQVRQSMALAYWPRVVGPQAAAATQVETVRDGVLFVRTRSSVWSHELTLHKTRILLELNRMLGGAIIHEIICRAQGVQKVHKMIEAETPTAEELALVVLNPEEKAE